MPRSRRWISQRRSNLHRTASAVDTALRFLAQRPRSEYEVRQRLRRAGLDEAAVDATLAQLKDHQLVDDGAFASYWIEQRQTFRPRGVRLLRAELRQHGVESTSVQAATEQLAPSAEDDAYRAASKRAQQLQDADARVFQAKLGQFLARRGFEWATVASVVERLTRERADRRDPAALETEAQ